MSALRLPERRQYTADDLLAMPSDARYELILGELIAMPPPPGGEHGNKTLGPSAYVTVFVEENDLGYCFAAETGFKIGTDPDTVMAADFAFVAKDRLPNGVSEKHVPLAPDIVMETRSPRDTKRSMASKARSGFKRARELSGYSIRGRNPDGAAPWARSTDTVQRTR